MRRLEFVIVELGKCANCGKQAGGHSFEGLCGPLNRQPVDAELPRQCFRGESQYAFVDLDAPHTERVA
jgi:hypothetical protein